ncbi:MAG TPA: hypothetical protein VGI19_10945 [Candidatus Cybelea sp.]|jgi:hypothetical protein
MRTIHLDSRAVHIEGVADDLQSFASSAGRLKDTLPAEQLGRLHEAVLATSSAVQDFHRAAISQNGNALRTAAVNLGSLRGDPIIALPIPVKADRITLFNVDENGREVDI